MAQAGIVISCERGDKKRSRTHSQGSGRKTGLSSAFRTHNNSGSNGPVAVRHLVDRGSIAFAILEKSGRRNLF